VVAIKVNKQGNTKEAKLIQVLSAFRTQGVPGPTSKIVAACLAQMGWHGMEHKWGNNPCIILCQGARSRGYKPCERVRAREGE
jgi:hypothetical protein